MTSSSLRLVRFGASPLVNADERFSWDFQSAFCGTPEYIAPELLESQGYTKTVDWWTLGVLLYEMMVSDTPCTSDLLISSLCTALTRRPSQTGLPPFYDENVNTMYQRILRDPLVFPPDMSYEAKSVMTGLLQRDPSRRLGHHGGEEIKRHPFFARHIDWNKCVGYLHILELIG